MSHLFVSLSNRAGRITLSSTVPAILVRIIPLAVGYAIPISAIGCAFTDVCLPQPYYF